MARHRTVPIEEVPPAQVLRVINEAFGRRESLDWYRWKHLEGPWGPSIGAAAVAGQSVIGVRLLLPWALSAAGGTVLAYRATEAATVPSARGLGVFSSLNRWMMDRLPGRIIFATPSTQSRGGHYKLGWQTITIVRYRWELASRRIGELQHDAARGVAGTDWDERSLAWRSDWRGRHRYELVQDQDAGLYYRNLYRGRIRGVAPLATFGPSSSQDALWRTMLQRSRAAFVMRPVTQPVSRSSIGITRGESLVVGWIPADAPLAARELSEAPWLHADLEAVI